jgi:hypothetical protein
MKKLIALLLACLMIVTMFAACGTKENEPSEPSTETPASSENPSEETSEQPSSEQQSEPEETGPRIVEAGTLNKHENGWYQNLDNGTDGVYFNLWANDIPADETWAVRYASTGDDNFTIIRDGETIYDVDCMVLKFSNTEYFLICDPWLLGSHSPLRAGDVLVLQGDFVDYDTGWGIHFDTTYITLKGENGAVFSTNPPA